MQFKKNSMKYAIGIDLGGTFIKYGLVDETGTICFHGKTPSGAQVSSERIIAQILSATGIAGEYARLHELHVAGVGIGTPGIVDAETGRVLGGAENLAGWENIPLADIIARETQWTASVDNDANVAALAESVFGAARGCPDAIFLTVGTGIGGAAVINGHLYRGYQNRGMELGHVPLFVDGETCACGAVGCLEHYASAAAMVRRFKKRYSGSDDRHIDGEFIVKLYHEGDAAAIASINENCRYLGRAIAGFINIFSPMKVVIGGGLADSGDFYLEKIRYEVARQTIRECAVNTAIERAILGNSAGCIGAATKIFQNSSLIVHH
jgi:glucokinase